MTVGGTHNQTFLKFLVLAPTYQPEMKSKVS